MGRGSNQIKPLFDGDDKKKEAKTQQSSSIQEPVKSPKKNRTKTTKEEAPISKESYTEPVDQEVKRLPSSKLSKYKKEPKYMTHVPHNIRIPKQMREEMEQIAEALQIPLGKNTGFLQEFTIDALRPAIEQAKKELGLNSRKKS